MVGTVGGGGTVVPASSLLDALGSTEGQILRRGASAWEAHGPGADGQVVGVASGVGFKTLATMLGFLLTARGDLVRRGSGGVERLALGTTGQVLHSDGTDVYYASIASILSNLLTARGDLVVRDGSGVARLAKGLARQVLSGDGTDTLWRDIDQVIKSQFGAAGGYVLRGKSDGSGWEAHNGTVSGSFLGFDGTNAVFMGGKYNARASKAAAQSIPHATETALQFDQDDFDNGGFHDPSTNNTRFVVPSGAGGRYLVFGTVGFASNGSGQRLLGYRLNGGVGTTWLMRHRAGTAEFEGSALTVVSLNAADYLEFWTYQDSGAALNTEAGDTRCGLVILPGQ